MKKLLLLFSLFFVSFPIFARELNGVDMATELRSSGKIYVVVAVVAVIFIGLAFYLFTMDNRIKKIEKLQK